MYGFFKKTNCYEKNIFALHNLRVQVANPNQVKRWVRTRFTHPTQIFPDSPFLLIFFFLRDIFVSAVSCYSSCKSCRNKKRLSRNLLPEKAFVICLFLLLQRRIRPFDNRSYLNWIELNWIGLDCKKHTVRLPPKNPFEMSKYLRIQTKSNMVVKPFFIVWLQISCLMCSHDGILCNSSPEEKDLTR